jgi:hypothetical protein
MRRVDRVTVKALELTAPGACRTDMRALYEQVRSGQIFGAFNEQDREVAWRGVLSVSTDRLIPSLYSFFEDVNYLQGPANCIRRLIELSPRDTLSSALENCFTDVDQSQCKIQKSESTFEFRAGSPADRLDFGRRQIWMSAMRNYLEIPAECKRRKKDLLAKPSGKRNASVLFEFAHLAYN